VSDAEQVAEQGKGALNDVKQALVTNVSCSSSASSSSTDQNAAAPSSSAPSSSSSASPSSSATQGKQSSFDQETKKWNLCGLELQITKLQIACLHEVVKQSENDLKPGECLVYRDLEKVNGDHGNKAKRILNLTKQSESISGEILTNLVLVRISRDSLGEDLKVLKVSHICTNPETRVVDAYFASNVFNHHFGLGKEGLFHGFHKICVFGGHGLNLTADETMRTFFFSRIDRSLAIAEGPFFGLWRGSHQIHVPGDHGPHYASNRCDDAGAEAKRFKRLLGTHDRQADANNTQQTTDNRQTYTKWGLNSHQSSITCTQRLRLCL